MCAQNLTSSLRYHGEDKHRDEVRYLSSRLLSMLTGEAQSWLEAATTNPRGAHRGQG
jgi:hypothetical protein